jgi:integrase
MARTIGRLTALKVRQAKKPGLYADGANLYLQIGKTGAKSWIYRYKVAGRDRLMGLGPLRDVGLTEAREAALNSRRMQRAGVDPLDAKRRERARGKLAAARSLTFAECARSYIATHEAGWRDSGKSARQWTASINSYCAPVFVDAPIQDVDTALVMRVLEPIWTIKPETGRRLRGRIESILDWATARGYRQGENPARWRGHLQNLLPLRSKVARPVHHPALPYRELPAFMAELRLEEGVGAAALEFCILTAARTGEIIGARWNEIDFVERLWIVPAARIKAEREHRVPLSDAALAILVKMASVRHGDFVFPGGRRTGWPMGHMTMLRTLSRMRRGQLTVHGFRSTFRDWCAEQTNFPAEAAEMALAHKVRNKVEAAYRRGNLLAKRRELMQAWAEFAEARPTGEIVQLRASVRSSL